MNQAISSMALILAAPWQQRRNSGGMWGIWLVVALFALVPGGLFVGSLVALHGGKTPLAEEIREAAGRSGYIACAALLVGAWVIQVASVLDQNHPTLARLVPAHVRRLRWCLLLAWLALTGLAAIAGARVNDAPLLWVAAAGASLAVLAAAVRRPLLWVLGCIAPYAVDRALHWRLIDVAVAAVEQAWHANGVAITATVMAAAAILLVAVVRSGGNGHIAFHERRGRVNARWAKRSLGAEPLDAEGADGWVARGAVAPYYKWLRRVVALPGSTVHSRTLLALGPATHWTTRLTSLAIAPVMVVLGALAVSVSPIAQSLPMLLASTSVGMMFALMSPMLQLHARLHQTRREQALLTLLPGMPRGGALSRSLSWQFSWQFLGTWVGCVGLMGVCALLSNAFHPGVFGATFENGRAIMAAAFLPLVALAWRPWARLPAPTQFNALFPSLAGLAMAAVMFFGELSGRVSVSTSGLVFALAALAWCALRWRRMANEPSAFPIGRLAP
jgi:hypothetical protein